MPPRQPPRKAKGAVAETSKAKATVPKAEKASKVEPKSRVAKRKVVETSPEPDFTSGEDEEEHKPAKKHRAAPKTKVEDEDSASKKLNAAAAKKPKAAKSKAKTKLEDATPLAERTAISSLGKPMYIGAHVSSAGGMHDLGALPITAAVLTMSFLTPI